MVPLLAPAFTHFAPCNRFTYRAEPARGSRDRRLQLPRSQQADLDRAVTTSVVVRCCYTQKPHRSRARWSPLLVVAGALCANNNERRSSGTTNKRLEDHSSRALLEDPLVVDLFAKRREPRRSSCSPYTSDTARPSCLPPRPPRGCNKPAARSQLFVPAEKGRGAMEQQCRWVEDLRLRLCWRSVQPQVPPPRNLRWRLNKRGSRAKGERLGELQPAGGLCGCVLRWQRAWHAAAVCSVRVPVVEHSML